MNDLYSVLENLERDNYHETEIIDFCIKYLKSYLEKGYDKELKHYTYKELYYMFGRYA